MKRPPSPSSRAAFLFASLVMSLHAPSALTARTVARSPVARAEAGAAGVGWAGLRIGMPVAEVADVVGHDLRPAHPPGRDRPDQREALVVHGGRIVRLDFRGDGAATRLVGIEIPRMGRDQDAVWTKEALVAELKRRVPELTYVPSRHDTALREADNPIPCYRHPARHGVSILVKPDEHFVLIAEDGEID